MPSARRGPEAQHAGSVVGVVGASGGAGASTLVAAVGAAGARRGLSCAVVDLQPAGGGLDVVCGIEHLAGLRWSDLLQVQGRVDGAALGRELPSVGGLAVLSHGRRTPRVPAQQVVAEVVRGLAQAFDVVVLDIARSAAGDLAQFEQLREPVVVIARLGVIEVSAAAAVLSGVETVSAVLVLRGPGGHRRFAREVGSSLGVGAQWLADEPAVARDLRAGRVPGTRRGALAEAADALLHRWLAGSGRQVAS